MSKSWVMIRDDRPLLATSRAAASQPSLINAYPRQRCLPAPAMLLALAANGTAELYATPGMLQLLAPAANGATDLHADPG